jgi:hypothetical protein
MRQSKEKALNSDGPSAPNEELPFRVELWHDGAGDIIERVLARAASSQLARAIFKAAQDEHPERRITLRKGERIIADSTK